jgi:hypothetical protein
MLRGCSLGSVVMEKSTDTSCGGSSVEVLQHAGVRTASGSFSGALLHRMHRTCRSQKGISVKSGAEGLGCLSQANN